LQQQQVVASEQGFENKYFQLVAMHRDNVAELELASLTGRGVFVKRLLILTKALHDLRWKSNINKSGAWWAGIAFRSPELIARAQSCISVRMCASFEVLRS
jgi:hypothetical protein